MPRQANKAPRKSDVARRPGKIDKLVSLASAEERQSGEKTGRAQSQLNDHLRRLAELNAYRQAYADKADSDARVHSVHWKDYQNFLFRLDEAVRSQQEIIHDSERTLESHRRRWMAKRQRLESLQRVQDRYLKEARVQAERREQRRLDDLPAQGDIFNDD